MKKQVLACVLALALCAGMCPALGVEETGRFQPDELWWYSTGEAVAISADRGASYGELPGLGEFYRRTGLMGNGLVMLMPLPGGGARVEAQGQWYNAENDTLNNGEKFQRDYSAAEVAQALAQAAPTPIRVLAASPEGVALAVRYVKDTPDFDLEAVAANPYIGHFSESMRQLLRTTDGVTWEVVDLPEQFWSHDGWWDGAAFHLTNGWSAGWRSADGLTWTEEPYAPRPGTAQTADLGPYHFQLGGPEHEGEVYLTSQTHGERALRLPDMENGILEKGLRPGEIVAWYGPDDTVILTVYDVYRSPERSFSMNYPTSSLDWCLENLAAEGVIPMEETVTDGAVTLALAPQTDYLHPYVYTLLRTDAQGGRWVTGPWGGSLTLLPYNGKTFLLLDHDGCDLYASADGLAWRRVDSLRPDDPDFYWNAIRYAFAWTGEEYLACRKAYRSIGRAGGGQWCEGNTAVYFLDEDFRVTDSHDFGRLVEAVGYLDGVYYAQVANSAGNSEGWDNSDEGGRSFTPFNSGAGSVIYRSTDGKSWTETELWVLKEELAPLWSDPSQTYAVPSVPAGERPKAGPAGLAQAEGYCFLLDYETVVVTDQKGVGQYVPGLPEALQKKWITPGFLSAQGDGKGGVTLTVRDMYTPSMSLTMTWRPEELKGFVDTGYGGWFSDLDWSTRTGNGTVNLALSCVGLHGLERIVYRTDQGEGPILDAPWSGSVDLFPYNGKTFLLRDRNSGIFYRSEDGQAWKVRSPAWATGTRYAFSWTGAGYLATQGEDLLFLDEDLALVSSHDFEKPVTAVLCRDGAFYAQVVEKGGAVLYRSTDGENWEATDILQVIDALEELR